tara:strand:+ start:7185 stop:7772 length:588 start_codon:yes stop_codon:yes gene_type:complete
MSYTFEYIDIILLAMIAGFIFLRLRGILGKRTGHEENMTASFAHESPPQKATKILNKENFNESEKKEFLKGAKIAYENIITCFSSGNLKEIKSLLDPKVLKEFNDAIIERKDQGLKSETTFIGINSADIKNHNEINNMLEVSVDFVSEIISCVKDKNNKIVSGNPEKIKKVYDTWKFSRNIRSQNPNWLLVDTQA